MVNNLVYLHATITIVNKGLFPSTKVPLSTRRYIPFENVIQRITPYGNAVRQGRLSFNRHGKGEFIGGPAATQNQCRRS